MKLKKLGLSFIIMSGVVIAGVATNTTKAAAYSHTIPVHMRGMWYSANYGGMKMSMTKHSYRYYPYKRFSSKQIRVVSAKIPHGKRIYNITFTGISGAYSSYIPGKMKINGKYHYVIVVDRSSVFTHFKTKHAIKVPKSFKY